MTQRTTHMTFGMAVEALKSGKRVARAGWNGKGMWLYYLNGHTVRSEYTPAMRDIADAIKLEPCIVMRTAQGTDQPGWLASQADMLSEDWTIVESAAQ